MDSFELRFARKNLPGKHGQQDLSAALAARPQPDQLIDIKPLSELAWYSLRSSSNHAGLGEPSMVRGAARQKSGRTRCAARLKGRSTDAECASRRTCTADDAGAAAQRHLQQHRQ